jgi:hypothetical protein
LLLQVKVWIKDTIKEKSSEQRVVKRENAEGKTNLR